jgi:hypothetical protein
VQSGQVLESGHLASGPGVVKNLAFKPCILMGADLQYNRAIPLLNVCCTLFGNLLEKSLNLVLRPNCKDTSDEYILFDR